MVTAVIEQLANPSPVLGVYFSGSLPPAALYPIGTQASTVDQGSMYSNGLTWQTTPILLNNAIGSTYTPPGTGAVATTVQQKLQQTVSVFDFMTAAQQTNVALNVGTIDVGAAIMAAITYLATNFGGGTINYPAGIYLVGTGTMVSYNATLGTGIYHQGENSGLTVIRNGNASSPAFNIGDGITIFFGGGIEKLRFTGKVGVLGLNGQTAFSISKVGQFSIRDVFVDNTGAALFRGVFFTNCSQFQIYNMRVQQCLGDGSTFLGTIDAYVTDCRSDANAGAGFLFNATAGCYFKGCTAFGNTGSGWQFLSGSPSTAPNQNNFFCQCVGDTSGTYNWQISDSKNSVFLECWGSTQGSLTVNTFATGFVVFTQFCKALNFTACIALNNNSHGFQLLDTGSSAPTQIDIDNCQFTGNGVAAGGGYGFQLNNACNQIRLNGGNVSGNATGSIQSQSTQTDIAISGSPIGYAPANNPLTAGASPWTSTPQITDSLVVLTTIGGISALTVSGVVLPTTVTSSFFLKAGHSFVATWTVTAPVFTFIPQS
jgi:hypothetical protein